MLFNAITNSIMLGLIVVNFIVSFILLKWSINDVIGYSNLDEFNIVFWFVHQHYELPKKWVAHFTIKVYGVVQCTSVHCYVNQTAAESDT